MDPLPSAWPVAAAVDWFAHDDGAFNATDLILGKILEYCGVIVTSA